MNDEFLRWYLVGHWVCVTQWLSFVLVEYAFLGKGRVKHPMLWAGVITLVTMYISVVSGFGFFTTASVLLSVIFLLSISLLFGGTLEQKMTACLVDGTMCLLTENTVRYLASWLLHIELQEVMQRIDCLVALSLANLVVGAAVAWGVGRWSHKTALSPLQVLTMSFFPGVVVVLNVLLMVTDDGKMATNMMLVITVGLTVAVLVHLGIVEMFNDQVVQRQNLYFQARLEQH